MADNNTTPEERDEYKKELGLALMEILTEHFKANKEELLKKAAARLREKHGISKEM